MKKIGHSKDTEELNIPQEVKELLAATLGILDAEYGDNRDIDRDLGGYVLVMEQPEDYAELEKLNIDRETAFEYTERIKCNNGEEYLQATMMSNNDFSIIIVTPIRIAMDWLIDKLYN